MITLLLLLQLGIQPPAPVEVSPRCLEISNEIMDNNYNINLLSMRWNWLNMAINNLTEKIIATEVEADLLAARMVRMSLNGEEIPIGMILYYQELVDKKAGFFSRENLFVEI